MSTTHDATGVSATICGFLRYSPILAERLAEQEGQFRFRDMIDDEAGIDRGDLAKLAHHNGIVKVGRVERSSAHYWRVSEALKAHLDRHHETPTRAPCGHTGVRCIVSGETFTCTHDGCDETFDKETAMEVSG